METTTHTEALSEAKRDLAKEAILASLRAGASRTTACGAARIARQTFYNWLKEDPDFEQEVVFAEVSVIQSVEAAALQCALQAPQDPRYLRFLTFYLKSRAQWDAEPKEPEEEPYRQPTREEILAKMMATIAEYRDRHGTIYGNEGAAADGDDSTGGDGAAESHADDDDGYPFPQRPPRWRGPLPDVNVKRPEVRPDPGGGTVSAEIFE